MQHKINITKVFLQDILQKHNSANTLYLALMSNILKLIEYNSPLLSLYLYNEIVKM